MRNQMLSLGLSLTLLTSCTWGGASTPTSPYPSTPIGTNTQIGDTTPPVGSSYIAKGADPAWSMSVKPGEAILMRPTESGSLDTRFEIVEDDKGGVITIRSVKGDMFLNMTRGSCSDGMSQEQYAYNATILVGADTLTGCALKK